MALSDRRALSELAARGAAQDQTVVCLAPASDQCDINVGLVIEASIPRVVPPRINSRSRECPYPPMTMRSGYVSAAYDRIVFETSILPTGMRSIVTFTPCRVRWVAISAPGRSALLTL